MLTGNITTLIPQRPPFVMIDRLISFDETVTSTGFKISNENILVEAGRFCEAGLVENIAQTAAARAGYVSQMEGRPVQVGYIGAIKNLAVYSLPMVDDELETTITVLHQVFDVLLVSGSITCRGVVVATCEMKIFISPSK